jgi:hypothetical protein
MQMTECKHPNYLCGFGPFKLLSQAAVTSSRANDLVKHPLSLVVGETPLAPYVEGTLWIGDQHTKVSLLGAQKVSLRLFNSILNL